MFLNSRTSFLKRLSHRPRRHARRRKQYAAPAAQIERLEDRTVLSAGLLDPTFGGDGLVTTDFLGSADDVAADVAVVQQPDGKIVAAGSTRDIGGSDFAVVRYNVDGSLDDGSASDSTPEDAFGEAGFVTTDFGTTRDTAAAVAIDAAGRIVVAGSTGTFGGNRDFALARYNSAGTLDENFGSGGTVTTDFGSSREQANSIAIAADGRILVAGTEGGDFLLARYNTDGSLDDGSTQDSTQGDKFGTNGAVQTDLGGFSEEATDLVIDSEGQIVAAGFSITSVDSFTRESEAVLARYDAKGRLDKSFGDDGRVETGLTVTFPRFSSPSIASSVAFAGERILVAGTAFPDTSFVTFDFALARFNSDGSLDDGSSADSTPGDSFGDAGRVFTDFADSFDRANGLAVAEDGRIVLVGRSGNDFALARYTSRGALDASFGDEGLVTTDAGSGADEANSVVIDANGRILAAGRRFGFFPNTDDFALARFNSDGSLDDTFGDGGGVITDLPGSQNDAAQDVVAVQPDGKIIVVGRSGRFSGDFAVARYNPDGTLDESFGGDGMVTTDFGDRELARSVVIDEAGRIVVAGSTGPSFDRDLALARYNTDGTLDETFGDGGKVITSFFFDAEATAVDLQSDGKIVVGGTGSVSGGSDFLVVRYNADGSLDNGSASDSTPDDAFGQFGSGFTETDFGFTFDEAAGLEIADDDRIILAGTATDRSFVFGIPDRSDFAVALYSPQGLLERSVETDVGSNTEGASGVALAPDGRIVVAGFTNRTDTGDDFAVVRYNADLTLDDGSEADTTPDDQFGEAGFVTADFGGTFDRAADVAVDDQERVVLAGETRSSRFSNDGDFALVRYDSNGNPDASFDDDGLVTTDFSSSDDSAMGLTIDAQDRIVVVGETHEFQSATGSDFALARYFGEPVPVVESFDVGADLHSFVIGLNDNDLGEDSTDLSNYRVTAANGDENGDGDPFNDGDEMELKIDSLVYDPGADQLTLNMVDAVFADIYRLELDGDDATMDGSPGIANEAGRFLLGGAGFEGDLDLRALTLVEDLLAKVESLGLSTGTEDSLAKKLEAAVIQLEVDVEEDAGLTELLEAFKLGVDNWFDLGEITLEQRDELIADTDLILLGIELTST